jgi:predicted RNA-binding Zn ribbon-like protein
VKGSVARVVDDLSEEERSFRFLSGRVCLDLTATVGERWRRNFERLRTPDDLGRWIVQSRLVAGPVDANAAELELARELRGAIYSSASALVHQKHMSHRQRQILNEAAAAPPPVPMLRPNGGVHWSADDKVRAALSAAARDAIDLFTGPGAARIRECASPSCALLFVDSSRPGQRRWCSSATCGGQARARTYRHRRAGSS